MVELYHQKILSNDTIKRYWETKLEFPNIVLLSSIFHLTDMAAERNIILDEVEPVLSQWCLNQGLEFQLVDMRWGVRDTATTDHMTTFLCLQEIQKCQEISLGPNFMVSTFTTLLTVSMKMDYSVNYDILSMRC